MRRLTTEEILALVAYAEHDLRGGGMDAVADEIRALAVEVIELRAEAQTRRRSKKEHGQ